MNFTVYLKHPLALWFILGCLLIAYSLPWVASPAAGLTLGAYDLAEWVSLHASARAAVLTLLPALLLRLPLACLGLLVALNATVNPWLRMIFVVVITAALLPPLEFFSTGAGDANYRQQAALATIVFVLGLVSLNPLPSKHTLSIRLILIFIASVSTLWGNGWAIKLMQEFNLPVQIGLGGIIYGALLVLLGIMVARHLRTGLPRQPEKHTLVA